MAGGRDIREWLKRLQSLQTPLVLSAVGAVVFGGFSLVYVGTDIFAALPRAIAYLIYACAAAFLALAAWALIGFFERHSLKAALLGMADRNAFSARLASDYSYRTMTAAVCSLVLNITLALAKMLAGWYYGSTWLMVLAGYYVALIVTRFVLVSHGMRQNRLTDKGTKVIHEWKAYRFCGAMLLVLTAFLQGIVILIVRDGKGFAYDKTVVIALAAYDFYRLGSAVTYMLARRKRHTPMVNAIKSVSLASSLVAMLSLQTAMFVAFDARTEASFKQTMNTVTGTAVCAALIVLGSLMLAKSDRELKCLRKAQLEDRI